MNVVIQFDGGCSMKHGIAAGAAVAYTEDGVELARRAVFLVDATTPIAEYTGLIVGLQLASELRATRVKAWGDAELIVRHVDGRYRCRSESLRGPLELVWRLMASFESCEVLEFPKAGPQLKRRHSNVAADALAARAMELRSNIYERSA